MKIQKQEPQFKPVIITLETKQEWEALLYAFNVSDRRWSQFHGLAFETIQTQLEREFVK